MELVLLKRSETFRTVHDSRRTYRQIYDALKDTSFNRFFLCSHVFFSVDALPQPRFFWHPMPAQGRKGPKVRWRSTCFQDLAKHFEPIVVKLGRPGYDVRRVTPRILIKRGLGMCQSCRVRILETWPFRFCLFFLFHAKEKQNHCKEEKHGSNQEHMCVFPWVSWFLKRPAKLPQSRRPQL